MIFHTLIIISKFLYFADVFDKTTILPHPCPVTCIEVNSVKNIIAAGQQDGGIALWSSSQPPLPNLGPTRNPLPNLGPNQFKHEHLLWGHDGKPVTLLKFHSNGDLLASASDSPNQGFVNIWSLAIQTVIQTIKFDVQEGPAKVYFSTF